MKLLHNPPRNARELYLREKQNYPDAVPWDELPPESLFFWNKLFKDRRESEKKGIVDDSPH